MREPRWRGEEGKRGRVTKKVKITRKCIWKSCKKEFVTKQGGERQCPDCYNENLRLLKGNKKSARAFNSRRKKNYNYDK